MESEARLAEARKALTEAESQLEVLVAQTELERAQTAVDVAQSRAQLSAGTYRTRLQQLGAEANADGTITITAPIAGIVADRPVTLGQSAEDAGAVLMTIVDDRTVWATANIYEKDVNQIAPGQRVRVTVSSLPDQIFEGQITTTGAVINGESRVVPVNVELDNPSGVLKPGMFAELEVLTDRTQAVLTVPRSALIETNGRQLVFVENGNSFEPVDVSLGRTAGDRVEVESGLFEGDQVVTQRANQLYAQSLRGGSSEPAVAEPPSPPRGEGVSWWLVVPVGGLLAVSTFAAGAWWSRRRHSEELVPRPDDSTTEDISFVTKPVVSHEFVEPLPDRRD